MVFERPCQLRMLNDSWTEFCFPKRFKSCQRDTAVVGFDLSPWRSRRPLPLVIRRTTADDGRSMKWRHDWRCLITNGTLRISAVKLLNWRTSAAATTFSSPRSSKLCNKALKLFIFQRYMFGAFRLACHEAVLELLERGFGFIKVFDGVARTILNEPFVLKCHRELQQGTRSRYFRNKKS